MSESNNDDAESESVTVTQPTTNVADAVFDKTARLVVLYVQIVLGAVGSTLVCVWLLINRRRTSRINTIIRNLACADMLVISFACVMQVRHIMIYDRFYSTDKHAGWSFSSLDALPVVLMLLFKNKLLFIGFVLTARQHSLLCRAL